MPILKNLHFSTSGDEVTSCNTGISYEVSGLGILQTKQIPRNKLYAWLHKHKTTYIPCGVSGIYLQLYLCICRSCGQVGYVVMGIRIVRDAHIGDTFHHTQSPVTPLPGFQPAKPMVYACIHLIHLGDIDVLGGWERRAVGGHALE